MRSTGKTLTTLALGTLFTLAAAAQTNGAMLVVNTAALIGSAPADQTVCPGGSASFSVSATGTGLSYQWYKSASPLAGQTGNSLTLNNVTAADAGSYTVVVTATDVTTAAHSSINLTLNVQ